MSESGRGEYLTKLRWMLQKYKLVFFCNIRLNFGRYLPLPLLLTVYCWITSTKSVPTHFSSPRKPISSICHTNFFRTHMSKKYISWKLSHDQIKFWSNKVISIVNLSRILELMTRCIQTMKNRSRCFWKSKTCCLQESLQKKLAKGDKDYQ